MSAPASLRLPVVYLAHGLPSYAIEGYPEAHQLPRAQEYVSMLRNVGQRYSGARRPRGVVCLSSHWETQGGVRIATTSDPKMVYDFHGFPEELYDMQYKAPGSPEIAAEVQNLVPEIAGDPAWGFDHGCWTLLMHVFPKADIPVVELSVDNGKPSQFYYELGKRLRPLRDRGLLLMGSGSVVHNLKRLHRPFGDHPPHSWAADFNAWVIENVEQRRDEVLFDYASAPGGPESVPTPDHYYPFLFALGAAYDEDERELLIDWVDNGANSMTSFAFGLQAL